MNSRRHHGVFGRPVKLSNFVPHQAVGLRKGILPRNKFHAERFAPTALSGESRVGSVMRGGSPVRALVIPLKLLQRKWFGVRSKEPKGRRGLAREVFHSEPGRGQLLGGRVPPRRVGSGKNDSDGEFPKYEQGLESSEQIFARIVRHELLTPLSGVVGMLDLVDNSGLLDPLGKCSLKHAKESARTLVEQVMLIMEYTSLVEGQLVLNARDLYLPQLIRDLTASWKARVEAKGLKFVVQILPDTPLSLSLDPHRFRRLIEILLSNAVKFTHSGEVAIGVGPGPRIWVRDTGIGISREQQAVIFQPFKQIDDSLARKFQGMGLGLAVAYHLAKAMNGLLSVTSRPGKGSVFSLKLPAAVTDLQPG